MDSKTYPECEYCLNSPVCIRLLNEGKVKHVSEIFSHVNYEGEPFCENLEFPDELNFELYKEFLK